MRRSAGYALMALHVVLAAGTYSFGKPAAAHFDDTAALTLLRSGGSAIVLLALTGWAVPFPRLAPREWLGVLGLGVLLVPLNQYFFLRGLHDTVPAHPALIYALTPAVVLLMTCFVARRPPPGAQAVGVGIAFGGVFVLLRPWEQGAVAEQLRTGDLWLCASLLVWSTYTVVGKPLFERHGARSITAWSLILGALVFAPFGASSLAAVRFDEIGGQVWFGIAWLVLITGTCMMFLWNVLLRHLEPVEVAICANAQPPAAALFAALLAAVGYLESNQDLGLLFWIGTAFVLAGVARVQWPARRPKSQPTPDA